MQNVTKKMIKYAATLTMSAAMAIAIAAPGQARDGRNAAVIGGVAAGAVVGAAVAAANSGYYYNNYDNGYGYAPGYGYAGSPYVYENDPVYGAYAYDPATGTAYRAYGPSCATDLGYGRMDYSAC